MFLGGWGRRCWRGGGEGWLGFAQEEVEQEEEQEVEGRWEVTLVSRSRSPKSHLRDC